MKLPAILRPELALVRTVFVTTPMLLAFTSTDPAVGAIIWTPDPVTSVPTTDEAFAEPLFTTAAPNPAVARLFPELLRVVTLLVTMPVLLAFTPTFGQQLLPNIPPGQHDTEANVAEAVSASENTKTAAIIIFFFIFFHPLSVLFYTKNRLALIHQNHKSRFFSL
jgi:hypothetical protein